MIVTTHSPLLADLIRNEYLFICHKRQGTTNIEPYTQRVGTNGHRHDSDDGLDEAEEYLTPSERIMRGDFDD